MYIKEFIVDLEFARGYSKNTVASYESDLKLFSDFLNGNIESAKASDVRAFIKKNSIKKDKTITRYITTLRMFYDFLEKKEYIKINPMNEIGLPKIGKYLPEVLTLDEVMLLLDIKIQSPFDFRNKCILELLYSTGIRITELTSLDLTDVNIDDDLIKVMGKGLKERVVPLNEITSDYLKEYIMNVRPKMIKKTATTALFLNNHGKRITRQAVFKMIKKRALEVNIKKNISPHTLRHSFATHMMVEGADIRFIQELLGHSDISTTQVYTHIANQTLKNDYEKLNPRDN